VNDAEVVIQPDAGSVASEAARRVAGLAIQAIAARGQFNFALAGGSTPAHLYRLLAGPTWRDRIDWERTRLFFGDERCVPPDHIWSNYRLVRETLLDGVPVPATHVFRVAGELGPQAAASRYAADLRHAFGLRGGARPAFDLVLLGMGEDGHTASLFPGMPALAERRRQVVATEVPAYVQPPVARVTLTFPVLAAAAQVLFLVTGANKAEKVGQVLGAVWTGFPERGGAAVNDFPLPAGRVRPKHGTLTWLLDDAAAGTPNNETPKTGG
jgi:6-phosphogluconolactonase